MEKLYTRELSKNIRGLIIEMEKEVVKIDDRSRRIFLNSLLSSTNDVKVEVKSRVDVVSNITEVDFSELDFHIGTNFVHYTHLVYSEPAPRCQLFRLTLYIVR